MIPDFLIADTHFGHDNIVKFCDRPPNHDELMVKRWNETIGSDNTVLHLGDLTFRGRDFFKHQIAPRLTGAHKYLILGNHDKQKVSWYKECGFEVIEPYTTQWNNWTVSFGHYPLKEIKETPPKQHVHLHGHIHNNGYGPKSCFIRPRQINLSVEVTGFRPVSFNELLTGYTT